MDELQYDKFMLDTNYITSKFKLFRNEIEIFQSLEKGKPYVITASDGSIHNAYHNITFSFTKNSITIIKKKWIEKKIELHQKVLTLLPILLVFWGGILGAIIGLIGLVFNQKIFNSDNSKTTKILQSIGILISVMVLYSFIAYAVRYFIAE
jgi:hypothetical protein